MSKIIHLIILTFLFVSTAYPQVQTIYNTSEMNAEKWRQDVRFMVDEMQKVHVNIFHTMSKAELDDFLTKLETKIPSLSDNQMIVELLKLMTMIGDGHSYMIPKPFTSFP